MATSRIMEASKPKMLIKRQLKIFSKMLEKITMSRKRIMMSMKRIVMRRKRMKKGLLVMRIVTGEWCLIFR